MPSLCLWNPWALAPLTGRLSSGRRSASLIVFIILIQTHARQADATGSGEARDNPTSKPLRVIHTRHRDLTLVLDGSLIVSALKWPENGGKPRFRILLFLSNGFRTAPKAGLSEKKNKNALPKTIKEERFAPAPAPSDCVPRPRESPEGEPRRRRQRCLFF